jgi:hypothetical protein
MGYFIRQAQWKRANLQCAIGKVHTRAGGTGKVWRIPHTIWLLPRKPLRTDPPNTGVGAVDVKGWHGSPAAPIIPSFQTKYRIRETTNNNRGSFVINPKT